MNNKTYLITGTATLLALVVVFQFLSIYIRFGSFSITLALIPIIVGAVVYGKVSGSVLGFGFGVTVLLTGDAALFLGYNVFGTIFIVLAKGTIAGLGGAVISQLLKNKSMMIRIVATSIAVPLLNTGIFALGAMTLLYEAIIDLSNGTNTFEFMFIILIGFNFIFEVAYCLIFSPIITYLCVYGIKQLDKHMNKNIIEQ